MGRFLNPGNTGFRIVLNDEIYVDKTNLLRYTNKIFHNSRRFLCVSRPRRFGKSTTVNMLTAYYGKNCDSSNLFHSLKIAQDESYEKHLNQYNVIRFTMTDFVNRENMLEELQTALLRDLRKTYGEWIKEDEKYLSEALADIYSETGELFVFIIDEWDCIFREQQENKQVQKDYLEFLREILKDKDYVGLAYMTGILPVEKYGTHSALNMFDEYSMLDAGELAEFVGFTEGEVETLCADYSIDISEMKQWYDGYIVQNDTHVYNPKSVVDAILRRRFGNYWTRTETYEALKFYLDMNFDGLKDTIVTLLGGQRYPITTDTFQNDMTTFTNKDDVLTLMVHLGYLSYDLESKEVFIPNLEIASEFKVAVANSKWDELAIQTMKDPYIFDFVEIREGMLERDVENELINHITNFLLEMGSGFAYMGHQKLLKVEEEEFFPDLLFYNTILHCYVVIDLKMKKFKPEYAGKMNFYLSVVDEQLKTETDNPSIGLILCRDKNKVVAEYSLKDMSKPIGVSEYKLTQEIPEAFRSALPDAETWEKHIKLPIEDGKDEE